MRTYWIETAEEDDELLVFTDDPEANEEQNVVSNTETTFILCHRCVKKMHMGEFKDNQFVCHHYGTINTKKYQAVKELGAD